jgi:hypothetical protein
MKPDPDTELAESWIAHWNEYHATGKFADYSTGQFVDLPEKDPEQCWRFIGQVLKRIEPKPDNALFQVLPAGPLEDLLACWGTEIIDRVEHQAAIDPRFKLLLGGVWRNTIGQDVWNRVEACRTGPW